MRGRFVRVIRRLPARDYKSAAAHDDQFDDTASRREQARQWLHTARTGAKTGPARAGSEPGTRTLEVKGHMESEGQ